MWLLGGEKILFGLVVIKISRYINKVLCYKKNFGFRIVQDQGTEFEFTVVQMLNQGSFPKSGCNRFRGSFFVTPFLEKQKSKS